MNEELDALRKIASGGKDYLIELQQKEALATGISSLKISFNNVFGYYLEVTHAHKAKVPKPGYGNKHWLMQSGTLLLN